MRAPGVKTLLAAFPSLERTQANAIRKLAHNVHDRADLEALIAKHCPRTYRHRLTCYSDPLRTPLGRREIMLAGIDEILGTCGVESLGPTDNDPQYVPRYQYCNTGDTYAATIVYKRDTDHLFVAAWGDIVEREGL